MLSRKVFYGGKFDAERKKKLCRARTNEFRALTSEEKIKSCFKVAVQDHLNPPSFPAATWIVQNLPKDDHQIDEHLFRKRTEKHKRQQQILDETSLSENSTQVYEIIHFWLFPRELSVCCYSEWCEALYTHTHANRHTYRQTDIV